MANDNRGEIQSAGGKSESGSRFPEQTRPGPVYSPAVDIFEHDSAITVLADMPGVRAQDLEIDLRENVLTLTGRTSAPEKEGQTSVLREYEPGTFFRQFTLGSTIEQSKIDAKLSDGVLRLELPKAEKARPRQIAVRTG
jgi:HSP20 family molecular chaperone IbpA